MQATGNRIFTTQTALSALDVCNKRDLNTEKNSTASLLELETMQFTALTTANSLNKKFLELALPR